MCLAVLEVIPDKAERTRCGTSCQVAGGFEEHASRGHPTPAPPQNHGSRAENSTHILPAEYAPVTHRNAGKGCRRSPPDADRDTEKAGHRRMSRRETRRRRMSGQVTKPDRDRLADQQAQDPPALRQVADPRDQLVVHAGVHELLQSPVAAKDGARAGRAGAAVVVRGPKVPGRAGYWTLPASAGGRDGGPWRRHRRQGDGVLPGLAGTGRDRQEEQVLRWLASGLAP